MLGYIGYVRRIAAGHGHVEDRRNRRDRLRGEWWTVFGDPQLNALEDQAAAANQDLKAAAARVKQSRAVTQTAKVGLVPEVRCGLWPDARTGFAGLAVSAG